MKVIHFEDAKVTEWSGGKTHELLIHPENSNFKSGDYDLRMSVATVNLEETTFTSLPGVNRILTVLEGKLMLTHEGHHTVKLGPYEQDRFQGDWTTKSKGKVRDFNVMWKNGSATVECHRISPGTTKKMEAFSGIRYFFIVSGEAVFTSNELQKFDMGIVENGSIATFKESCTFLEIKYISAP
ncbi:MAG: environmental stress-induced protein Ves [Flavobacteriaceae bacterium]|jgi:environmental stress-induced protein Ves